LALILCGGCSVNLSFDPSSVFDPIEDALDDAGQAIEDALSDPLSSKPFPVLIGGDDERLFYATNLGDFRINFPGPTNDIVIPGYMGPSNLYRHQDNRRELIRPLVQGSPFLGLATDGRFVAFITVTDDPERPYAIRAAEIGGVFDRIVFDGDDDESHVVNPSQLAVDDGRVAFVLSELSDGSSTIRIEDLTQESPPVDVESDSVISLDLRGSRLAYVSESTSGSVKVIVHDLSTSETIFEVDARPRAALYPDVFLDLNSVIWSEPTDDGLSRVSIHEIPTEQTRILADSVHGFVTGATSEHFVTEQYVDEGFNRPLHIVVRRYDADGGSHKLAEFRADGLAGQVMVVGNRAAWVNDARRIVVQPLAGDDRDSFRPF